ncbi:MULTISPECIES: hypothetical protein [Vibrio]|nr:MULTISPECIES: hypothetical protein [Vibrio]
MTQGILHPKTDAKSVVRFIATERIEELAKREALKWLKDKQLI